jgi:hypothetical protein
MDSFWNFANAVKSAVVEQTETIQKSLQSTDWTSELNALKSGIKSETEDFSQRAKQLTDNIATRTVQAAKQIPKSIVNEKNTVLDARYRPENPRNQEAVTSFSGLRDRLYNGTSELMETFNVAYQEHWRDSTEKGTRSDSGDASEIETTSAKFSLLEAEIAAMERDPGTYCDTTRTGDVEGFNHWLQTFDLDAHHEEIALICQKNGTVGKMKEELVPSLVDDTTFWTRYFYKLQKLKDRHAKVVALATGLHASSSEQDLGWESEKDEEELEPHVANICHEETKIADHPTNSTEVSKDIDVADPGTSVSLELRGVGDTRITEADEKDTDGASNKSMEDITPPEISGAQHPISSETEEIMHKEASTLRVIPGEDKHADSIPEKHLDESEWDDVADWE